MTCLVLAAGYATRLYPLTKNFPKPLLKVKEKTVLDWLVDDIADSCHPEKIAVITNHRFAHFFETWKSESKSSCPIQIIDDQTTDNDNRLGAVMDIQKAIEKAEIEDDLMVIAGDNVLDFSLGSFARYFHQKHTTCIMRYQFTPSNGPCPYGVCSCDEDDKVLDMEEKPAISKSDWAVPPFYIYARKDLPLICKAIRSGCEVDAPGSFIQWLCRQVPVHAMKMPGNRYDIGNLASYEKIQKEYKGILTI